MWDSPWVSDYQEGPTQSTWTGGWVEHVIRAGIGRKACQATWANLPAGDCPGLWMEVSKQDLHSWEETKAKLQPYMD